MKKLVCSRGHRAHFLILLLEGVVEHPVCNGAVVADAQLERGIENGRP